MKNSLCELELKLIRAGLINVKDLDATFLVDLKYAGTDNFIQTNVYGELQNCYLHPDVANMLVKAHQFLKQDYPQCRFLLWDGARALSVQQIFWDKLDMPDEEKDYYLADPKKGSIHNFGCAIDLTIMDINNGNVLDMGTGFDDFVELAWITLETKFIEEGRLTRQQVDNRLILRNCMEKAGFSPVENEWWHFSTVTRAEAFAKYSIIE
jgi:D-alanyl-D-alanine dipeptidase